MIESTIGNGIRVNCFLVQMEIALKLFSYGHSRGRIHFHTEQIFRFHFVPARCHYHSGEHRSDALNRWTVFEGQTTCKMSLDLLINVL